MLISSPEDRKEDILASFACNLYQMIKKLPNLREIPVGMLYLDDYLICFSFFNANSARQFSVIFGEKTDENWQNNQ